MIGKNIFVLRGNVTRKPEIRYTPEKIPVAAFTVAENYHIRNAEKQWETKVRFHDVVAFNFVAERAGKYLDKGYAVECEGRLTPQTIEDSVSGKRYRTHRLIVYKYSILARPLPLRKDAAEQLGETEAVYANPEEMHEHPEEEYEDEEPSATFADEQTFYEFLEYDTSDIMRDMAARNPAYYQ